MERICLSLPARCAARGRACYFYLRTFRAHPECGSSARSQHAGAPARFSPLRIKFPHCLDRTAKASIIANEPGNRMKDHEQLEKRFASGLRFLGNRKRAGSSSPTNQFALAAAAYAHVKRRNFTPQPAATKTVGLRNRRDAHVKVGFGGATSVALGLCLRLTT